MGEAKAYFWDARLLSILPHKLAAIKLILTFRVELIVVVLAPLIGQQLPWTKTLGNWLRASVAMLRQCRDWPMLIKRFWQ